MATTKNAILKGLVEGQIVELLIKTNVENVLMEDGSTTLSAKLAEMVTEIGKKANSADVTNEIKAAIDALIDGAPGTYDTLKEIADYLSTHADEYTALVQTVAGKASQTDLEALEEVVGGKVDKVDGKGLSTNDYTTAEKEKLAGIAAGAQVNVLEKVSVNGVEQTVTEKGVNISVPTGALAEKDIVSESDLATELKEKVNAAAEGNHSHANKEELDKIASGDKAKWDEAAEKAHEHANKEELDKIAAGDKAKWDAAEQNAKDYADGLNTAMDTRVKAVEGKAHEHANKAVLDGITEAKVTEWDAKTNMYIQAEQPANLQPGDLWVQIV